MNMSALNEQQSGITFGFRAKAILFGEYGCASRVGGAINPVVWSLDPVNVWLYEEQHQL